MRLVKVPVIFARVSSSFLFFLVVLSSPTQSHSFIQELLNFITNAISPSLQSNRQVHSSSQSELESDYYFSRPSRQLNGVQSDTEDKETTKCFGELGCVENTDEFFHILHRPFNLLPEDRHRVGVKFGFFNRNRTVDPTDVYLNGTHLLEQGFDPTKPVKFIAHGFLDSGYSFWVVKLAQAFLLAGDFNVFVVDWGRGALSLYTQATANTRLVGLEIAHYIKFLQREFQVRPEDCHCTGHSLGAHVCGYAGEKLEGQLGRITGLDPAEPYYQYLPHQVRLDPSDAKFVDIIHSDGRTILLLGLGMIQPCGHIDFYPNDGKDQPGCELTEIPANIYNLHGYDEVEREVVACNHHRAVYYFLEAVINRCQFVAHLCEDYQTYLKGQCSSCGPDGSNCAQMGLDADKYPIGRQSLLKFYFSTAKAAPFCVRHYRINVHLARPEQAASWVRGKLKISIDGSKSSLSEAVLTNNARFHHGKNFTFLIQSPKKLGKVIQMKIDWKYGDGYFGFMSSCWKTAGCNDKLFVKAIDVIDMDDFNNGIDSDNLASQGKSKMAKSDSDSNDATSSTTLCGDEETKYTGIPSGSSALFHRLC